MARIFISHSSKNDHEAAAMAEWLQNEGWVAEDDIFLDFSAEHGIAAGQQWVNSLEAAQSRCEAVIFLISRDWLESAWCKEEYTRARELNKKLFAVLIDGISFEELMIRIKADWQIISVFKSDESNVSSRLFTIEHPHDESVKPIRFTSDGLTRLKRGLDKCQIRPGSFDLVEDVNGPMGWRSPYRGLAPLEEADAAVFFGRDADIVRGLDMLRGLRASHPPRFMVILGASGAGKSSFLRAGLVPRLKRDDANWVVLNPVRTGENGPIESREGLLASLLDAQNRMGVKMSRAELRKNLSQSEGFIDCLNNLSSAAKKRSLRDAKDAPPQPIIALDQAEELFSAEAHPDTVHFLKLLRNAMETGSLLCVVTIRSDRYSALQSAPDFEDVIPMILSLPPIATGELSKVINGPAEFLRSKARDAPVFSPKVSAALMGEVERQEDALPLLAFTLSNLMQEFYGRETKNGNIITLSDMEAVGGVFRTIESEASKALRDVGLDGEGRDAHALLRRIFIPRLARINPKTRLPERRVASLSVFYKDRLNGLVQAFVDRRLLTLKGEGAYRTVEVSHESLLRQWPTLSAMLKAETADLLRLDAVLRAADNWERHDRTSEYIDHRRSRLEEAFALADRNEAWKTSLVTAREYLSACRDFERVARRRKRVLLASTASVFLLFLALIVFQQLRNAMKSEEITVKTLEERSIILAKMADSAFESGNATEAILIALEAWNHDPKYFGDRNFISSRILDYLSSYNELKFTHNHSKLITNMSFNMDGSLMISCGWDGKSLIWDTTDFKVKYSFDHDGIPVTACAINMKNNIALTTTYSGQVLVWNLTTGKLIQKVEISDLDFQIGQFSELDVPVGLGHVTSLQFNANSNEILLTTWLGTIATISLPTLQVSKVYGYHDSGITTLFSAYPGFRSATSGRNVWTAKYSADYKYIISGGSDYSARIFHEDTGLEYKKLNHTSAWIQNVGFSGDSKIALTTEHTGQVRLWNVPDGTLLFSFKPHSGNPLQATFLNGNSSEIIVLTETGALELWQKNNSPNVSFFDGTSSPNTITYSYSSSAINGTSSNTERFSLSPDGSLAATGSFNGHIIFWRTEKLKPDQPFMYTHHYEGALLSVMDGGENYLITSGWGNVNVWDLKDKKFLYELKTDGGGLSDVMFSQNGDIIAGRNSLGSALSIWRTSDGELINTFDLEDSRVQHFVFSSSGKKLAVVFRRDSERYVIKVFNAKNWAELFSIETESISEVVFAPAENEILAIGDNGNLFSINLSSKQITKYSKLAIDGEVVKLRTRFLVPQAQNSILFHPSGNYIIASGLSGFIQVFEFPSMKHSKSFRSSVPIMAKYVLINKDGSRLLAATTENEIIVWDFQTGAIVEKIHDIPFDAESFAFSDVDNAIIVSDLEGRPVTIPLKRLASTTLVNIEDRDFWIYAMASKHVNRCLSQKERNEYNLTISAPCWCTTKIFPPKTNSDTTANFCQKNNLNVSSPWKKFGGMVNLLDDAPQIIFDE